MVLDPNFDKSFLNSGDSLLFGIDEVGRGAIAGPISLGLVGVDRKGLLRLEDLISQGLNDSKKLTPKSRIKISSTLKEKVTFYCVLHLDNRALDKMGVSRALQFLASKAVSNARLVLGEPSHILSDGPKKFTKAENEIPIIKGDGKSSILAAASVLAKVERDAIMTLYDRKLPEYGFATHVGYGTTKHLQALKAFGLTEIHRTSFAPVARLRNADSNSAGF